MARKSAATILTKEAAAKGKKIPPSLLKTAGLLRRHKRAMEQHIRKVRSEWDR